MQVFNAGIDCWPLGTCLAVVEAASVSERTLAVSPAQATADSR